MKIKRTIFAILVIVWMIAVFCFSSQQSGKSNSTSGNVIRAGLNQSQKFNQLPKEEQETVVEKWQRPIRKLAHFTIYTIGGILIFNLLNTYNTNIKRKIIYTIVIGMLYATSDEIHQLFIDGRSGQVTDILIDTAGVAVGCMLMYWISKLIKTGVIKNGNKKGC